MNIITKYRPQTFGEVRGHKSIIKSLTSQIKQGTPTHAYLLTGTTGCGKTTIARILASELGCSGTAIIEINCAVTNGIGDIRNLVDKLKTRPLNGGNICLILDEAQQLTTPAQNALLKVVEDAPEFVFFVFASTEVGNMIPTLKNRLVKYDLRPLSQDDIVDMIADMWFKELYPTDPQQTEQRIIRGIAKVSNGIPREAITLFAKLRTLDIEEARELVQLATEDDANLDIIGLAKLLISNKMYSRDEWQSLLEKNSATTIKIVLCNYFKGCLLRAKNFEKKRYIYFVETLLQVQQGPLEEASLLVALYKISEWAE